MLRLGWQTFWRHVGDVVAPERARRASGIAVVVTVLAAAGMTALELHDGWTGNDTLLATTTIALLSLGVGLVAFACCPLARPVGPSATINGRQVRADIAVTVRQSNRKYLARRPPPIAPQDREAVLVDVALYRRGVVLSTTRATAALGGGMLAATGTLLHGYTPVVFLFMVVYCGNVVSALIDLGRAERARRAAESLAPLP